jgi:dienelactone hydrolase
MAAAGRPGGAAGSVGPGATAPGGTGATGATPAGTGGVSGAAGAAAAAGGSVAGAGGSVAGAGGMAVAAGSGGMAGAPSAGAAAPGDAFIREKDPTEASVTGNGEYMVMSYTEAAGLRNGPDYGDADALNGGAEVYYPIGATPPFGGVVVVPGFTALRADIAYWGPFLASHGIVTMAIDTNTTGDQPDVRSRALVDALVSLKAEHTRSGSPLEGKLDVMRMGVMGWSMGGGGTWITADSHPELKVAVSLCGWLIGSQGSRTTVPSLQLAVVADPLAAGMSQPIYAAIPEMTPKMLIEWNNGDHWFNNNPANGNKQVGRYGLSWIKVFLEKDERYRQFLKTMPMDSTDFQTNQK